MNGLTQISLRTRPNCVHMIDFQSVVCFQEKRKKNGRLNMLNLLNSFFPNFDVLLLGNHAYPRISPPKKKKRIELRKES